MKSCKQIRNQCCCPCPNPFDQVRRLFTGCELLRTQEFTKEFFKRFGRLPSSSERRCIEEDF
ncbi:hypothetical protein [Bacillus sp. SA1-12]|uniref:hypothetical protein n=1 Tax=Bacillus sp. SA1-12 TaxID=1455638 RepID=UPI000AE1386B|nr:hypothetical protein [Bacillus sp. SA1-12]